MLFVSIPNFSFPNIYIRTFSHNLICVLKFASGLLSALLSLGDFSNRDVEKLPFKRKYYCIFLTQTPFYQLEVIIILLTVSLTRYCLL